MQNFWMGRVAGVPADGTPKALGQAEGVVANQAAAASPPTARFRLVRYFSLASFTAFLLFAAALLYFEHLENDFFKQVQQEQNGFFAQLQDSFLQRHDPAASAYLLRVYEAGNINLERLFSNAMWEKDFAPFVAKAQRIPVDQCRTIAEIKDAGGKTVQPGEKQACYAGIGRQIVALPEFRGLDARVFDTMKKSTVFKIKVYDLRGITVYSSEHNQIGEDKTGDAGWVSAAAGKPASALTHRDQFSAFEGVVVNRDLVSTYLPVLAPSSENIVGVFEVYSDVTPFLEQIDSTSSEIRKLIVANQAQVERAAAANREKVDANAKLLLAAMFGTLALLYLALYLIVKNAQRIIDKQDLERRWAELTLARQKDLYDALSRTNKAIVHLTSREELFEIVCRIAVEHGRFRFAWIGLIDKDDLRLRPVAHYGEDAGYMNYLDVSGDSAGASKNGLTGRTLLSGTYVVSNDFLHDPATAPWHEAARRAGVQASAKFPIRQGGSVVGAISFYAGETGFFTEELIATLDEIARDVSFALDNFQHETERARAVEALRESEARYRSLFANSEAVMLLVDPTDGSIMEANPAACAYYGYDPAALLGMKVYDINILNREQVRAEMDRAAERGKYHFDFRHRLSNGEVRDVEVFVSPVEIGGRTLFFSIVQDVTERVRAGRQLVEAEARFRGLIEQSIAGIFIIQDGKFAYVNPRVAEIHGYASEYELIGTDPSSLVVEKDVAGAADIMRRLLDGSTTGTDHNLTARRKDGSTVELGLHSARASYRGRPAVIGMMQDISEKKRAEEQIRRYVAQLETAFMSTVGVATTLSEMRDPYTAGHERRVAEIAVAIGAEIGFDARRQEGLRVAGYLHDIGKITIPSEILSKPGKLSPIEFKLIQGHPQASYDVLKEVKFPWPVAEVALEHHERVDGSGYPQGFKGEAILLEARIMAVADVVEAMSSHRPYRPGLGIDKALAEIERGRGSVYDAEVSDACLRLFREKSYALPT